VRVTVSVGDPSEVRTMQNREWVDETFELLVSSDEDNGAVDISQKGSKFSVRFDEPLGLPRGAINPTVQCMGSSIWWTIPNVNDTGVEKNNLFGFTYTRNSLGVLNTLEIDASNNLFAFRYDQGVWLQNIIPSGSYTFLGLLEAMRATMSLTSGLTRLVIDRFFDMALDPVTGRVTIRLDVSQTVSLIPGGSIIFNAGVSPHKYLGWPPVDISFGASRGTSNLPIPIPGVFEFTSPEPSYFAANIVSRTGLSIPEGLYNIDQLGEAMRLVMRQNGLSAEEANSFFGLDGDNATQLCVIYLNCPVAGSSFNAPYAIEFGVAGKNGFESLLGFDNWPRGGLPGPARRLLGNYPGAGGDGTYSFIADSVAAFNRLNYLLLHTDLVPRGIRFNGNFNQIVAQVLVDVGAGQQIVYAPFNPPISDAANLVGAQRTTAQFWLTDDTNQPVNTFGETWSMRLVFKYKIAK
jgi:hypothetical protein